MKAVQKAKLTLSVDPSVIDSAKAFARKSGISVSEMVERYLEGVSGAGRTATKGLVTQLRGCARSDLSRMSDAEIRDDMYKERHNL